MHTPDPRPRRLSFLVKRPAFDLHNQVTEHSDMDTPSGEPTAFKPTKPDPTPPPDPAAGSSSNQINNDLCPACRGFVQKKDTFWPPGVDGDAKRGDRYCSMICLSKLLVNQQKLKRKEDQDAREAEAKLQKNLSDEEKDISNELHRLAMLEQENKRLAVLAEIAKLDKEFDPETFPALQPPSRATSIKS